MIKKTATAIAIALSFAGTMFAGSPMGKQPVFDPFAKGAHELQIQAGTYFEFSHEPKIDFADVAVRYPSFNGWQAWSPSFTCLTNAHSRSKASRVVTFPGWSLLRT